MQMEFCLHQFCSISQQVYQATGASGMDCLPGIVSGAKSAAGMARQHPETTAPQEVHNIMDALSGVFQRPGGRLAGLSG
jgi:hypothetical protein